MRRREFIGIVGGAAAWPLAASAQQPTRIYRIAFVHPSNPVSVLTETGGIPFYKAFFEELRRLGYVEGRNLAVARYSGEGRTEHYAELAQEVVRTQPDVIVTLAIRLVLSFKAASSTIPIVASIADPVSIGLAASLARPGGNVTGVDSASGPEYYAKLLELLKDALPTLSAVGFIATRPIWGSALGLAIREGAQRWGIELIPGLLERHEEADYRTVFEAMVQRRVDAVVTGDQSETFTHRQLIVELAEKNKLPMMTPFLEAAEIGGLIAYAPDRKALFRYLASCVDKVLRGEMPGEIPIYKSDRYTLVINLKTAKTLGLMMPASFVALADEVIE